MLTVAQILQFAACVYIIGVSLLAINKMSRVTAHSIRWPYIALVVGALAEMESAYRAGDVLQCLFVIGVALFLCNNRRGSRPSQGITP